MQRALRVHSCHPPRALLRGGRGRRVGGGAAGGWDCPNFPLFEQFLQRKSSALASWKQMLVRMAKHNKRIFSRSTSSECADELLFYWLLKLTVFSSLCPNVCVSSPRAVRRARSSRASEGRKSSAAFIIHKQKKAAAEQQLGALLQPRGWS